MKYPIIRFKSLKVCLKELEPFILNGEHLQTGKPIKKFGALRPREILVNWLLCVVFNFEKKLNAAMLCTAPLDGDGIIYDSIEKKSYLTEHILIPRINNKLQDIESLILQAIEKKQKKGGAAYASGKTLIVFLNTDGGEWHPNKVARNLPKTLDFLSVCIVGLQGIIKNEYIYNVTTLNPSNCPIWQIRIEKDFSDGKYLEYNEVQRIGNHLLMESLKEPHNLS